MNAVFDQEQEARVKLILNLGAGPRGAGAPLPAMFGDWREVRVDVNPEVAPDILADITDLSAIETGSADAVWTAHCIEHVYLHQVQKAVSEVYRILRDDGFFCLVVPDLQAIAEFLATDRLHDVVYQSPAGPITAHDILYGYGPYLALGVASMAHKCGFTPTLLLQKLQEAPFAEIVLTRRSDKHELAAVAFKRAPADETERQALVAALELFEPGARGGAI